MAGNGETKSDFTTFHLIIRWVPELGQISVSWPPLDDVMKLGMLEMAKEVLAENRASDASVRAQKAGIVLPPKGAQ